MLDASGVGAELDVDQVPLSDALRARFGPDEALGFAMTGGDDYELCFTMPAVSQTELRRRLENTPVA